MENQSILNNWSLPKSMQTYLQNFGWHFNKNLFEYATKQLKQRNVNTGEFEPLEVLTKEQYEKIIGKYETKLENIYIYDVLFLLNYAKSVFYPHLIKDEKQLISFANNYFNHPHYADTEVLKCWYVMQLSMGKPIEFSDFL